MITIAAQGKEYTFRDYMKGMEYTRILNEVFNKGFNPLRDTNADAISTIFFQVFPTADKIAAEMSIEPKLESLEEEPAMVMVEMERHILKMFIDLVFEHQKIGKDLEMSGKAKSGTLKK
jgi:hypothetical protein